MKQYEFEGKLRTVREVQAMVPFLSDTTIRKYLNAGMRKRLQMTTANPKAGRVAGGKRGAKLSRRIAGEWRT